MASVQRWRCVDVRLPPPDAVVELLRMTGGDGRVLERRGGFREKAVVRLGTMQLKEEVKRLWDGQ